MTTTLRDALPVPPARVDPGTEPFWAAAREDRLVVPFCPACEQAFWYPRGFCPRCGGDDVTWVPGGGGTVYAASVVRKAHGAWSEVTPYVVAYVELDAGVRVLTHVVGCGPDDVHVGLPVVATFTHGEPRSEDDEAPVALRFRPA